MPSKAAHVWTFRRLGGLDQVTLTTAADLLHLKELDPKLWVALSCPTRGLELPEATLSLLDHDGDARIRVADILAAIEWSARRLGDVSLLLSGRATLPLSVLRQDTDEGRAVLAAAVSLLAGLGRSAAAEISLEEAERSADALRASAFNGDGVIAPNSTEDPLLRSAIADAVACLGGNPDRSGQLGVDQALFDTFLAELAAYEAWHARGMSAEVRRFGDGTEAASAALAALRAKIEDYFTRSRLAQFDARAAAPLNRYTTDYAALAGQALTAGAATLAAFPLAHVEPGRPLPLVDGINPAWSAAVEALRRDAVAPLYGAGKTTLTETEWRELERRIAAFDAHIAAKAGARVESLGMERIRALLAATLRDPLAALIVRDLAAGPHFDALPDVARLLRLTRDFGTLLRNFVNFEDFYAPDRPAIFQAGTLYLDTRSTLFCIHVEGPSPLAAMSKAYIAYCDLRRAGSPPAKIAACFTQGDSDYLFVGRNGVFIDRQGRDWDATITSIVDNPISIRQAFSAPYKKLVRLVEEQVARRAAAADAASHNRLATAAETAAHLDKQRPPEAPRKVDVGAVAAIGVAVTGAVSVITLMLGYLFGMKPWQYPLVLAGLIAAVSGPSMLIAWLKIRQRTLGPILEGNGWAINGRVRINLPLGSLLTQRATLPPGTVRRLDDPYLDRAAAARRRMIIVFTVVLLVVAGLVRFDRARRGHYFWQPAPATDTLSATADAGAATSTATTPAKPEAGTP
jgi:hypothetical protein